MRSLTWKQVWGWRLTRHALLSPQPKENLVEVVRTVCGIHAQIMPAAELSIGVRVAEVTQEDVRAELWQRRSLVKTYGLRGTVHLFPADDLPLWVAAFRADQRANDAHWFAQMGLELTQVEAIKEAIGKSLDGQCLTREQLGMEVARRLGSWVQDAVSPAFGGKWPRWQIVLGSAAHAGLLCFGPNQGQKVTFVRPDQWFGRWKEIDGATALREVMRCYLSAYGPATHHSFAQWFTMPPGRASTLMRELADELEEVDVEGYPAWLLSCDAAIDFPSVQDVVRLLPHFDCYLIGCHPRDRLVPADQAKRVLTYGGIGKLPVMVVDGVVAGLWQKLQTGKRLEIRVEPFEPLAAQQHQELESAVARIGEILGVQSTLTLAPVNARPHL